MRYRLTGLISNTGDRVTLPPSGVICIVGGNNAGKSQVLRDISMYVREVQPTPLVALQGLEAEMPTATDEEEWLNETAVKHPAAPGSIPTYSPIHGGTSLQLQVFRNFVVGSGPSKLGSAADFFLWHASAGSLVSYATGSLGYAGMGPATSPLANLFRDGDLEEELSTLSREVFGESLTLDRVNGDVRLRVGEPDIEAPLLNHPTVEYADAVRDLPSLEHQGDGMKAFMGLALNVVAGRAQVLLIDEPEAFLHPAQARALGRWLANESQNRDRQVLLATHDRDLVLGLLDADAPVTMVRVARTGNETHLYELSEARLSEVWADPVLRYSNVLQGLFHERVVVCEADADCRFYGAVLDNMASETGRRSTSDSTLFVPSGGKQRAAVLAEALAQLGVTAYAISDFDILRTKADIEGLVSALGQVWDHECDDLYTTVASWLNQTQAWESAKNQGVSVLKAGTIYNAGTALLKALVDRRVLVVPVGEMEGFDRSIAFHGSPWVSAMLEKDGHKECGEARSLVAHVISGA